MIQKIIRRQRGRIGKELKGDISLSVIKRGGGDKGEVLSLRFLYPIALALTKSGYISLGFDDEINRLYFYDDRGEGYKISVKDGETVGSVKVTVDKPDFWKLFIGSYILHRDKNTKLYYIDLKPKTK